MITIDLRLFATLAEFLPENPESYQVSDKTTVAQLIVQLGLPDQDVKLIFVNGIKKNRDCVLKNNDRVGMFPPVGGG